MPAIATNALNPVSHIVNGGLLTLVRFGGLPFMFWGSVSAMFWMISGHVARERRMTRRTKR
jgi:hypothetical protein